MSYMHINNLYKAQEVLQQGPTCYALEKIHGTSANIAFKDGKVTFFSGGESHANFVALFDVESLTRLFTDKFFQGVEVIIYGEAYGGKQQHMSETYGKALKFVAFEANVEGKWLAVPEACFVARLLGLDFVDWSEIPTTIEAITAERDKPSVQSIKNGITEPKIREGVVLRPLIESVDHRGNRIMAKFKREEFSETHISKKEVDPSKFEAARAAKQLVAQWVTPMRLEHVIDRLISTREDKEVSMEDTRTLIGLMVEDVTREGRGEIDVTPLISKEIGASTARLLKQQLNSILV